jgi:hypothetical protein
MASKLGQGLITDGRNDPRSLRGIERRRELRAEDADEIRNITEHLIAGLECAPIGAEVVAAELVARTVVKVRRLAERGRDDLAERELLSQLMMTTPFGMVTAPPPVPSRIGPRSPGATYFVVDKGDDAVPDGAREPAVNSAVDDVPPATEPTPDRVLYAEPGHFEIRSGTVDAIEG